MKCSNTEYNGSPWEWRPLGMAAPWRGSPRGVLILGVAAPGNGGSENGGRPPSKCVYSLENFLDVTYNLLQMLRDHSVTRKELRTTSVTRWVSSELMNWLC